MDSQPFTNQGCDKELSDPRMVFACQARQPEASICCGMGCVPAIQARSAIADAPPGQAFHAIFRRLSTLGITTAVSSVMVTVGGAKRISATPAASRRCLGITLNEIGFDAGAAQNSGCRRLGFRTRACSKGQCNRTFEFVRWGHVDAVADNSRQEHRSEKKLLHWRDPWATSASARSTNCSSEQSLSHIKTAISK
jgi:hypothetical protein